MQYFGLFRKEKALVRNYTKPENETRAEIDKKLKLAGWTIQDKKRINLFASLVVAVREMDTDKRWKSFTYDELITRDKTNLDIFWLKDESLEDTENLPAPEVLAAEIVEQLEAALAEFRNVEEALTIDSGV